MAIEYLGNMKRKRRPKDPARSYLSISVSIDFDTLDQVIEFSRNHGLNRSEGLRQLVEDGLSYATVVRPEMIAEAERRQNVASAWREPEAKHPTLVDVELLL